MIPRLLFDTCATMFDIIRKTKCICVAVFYFQNDSGLDGASSGIEPSLAFDVDIDLLHQAVVDH